MTIDLILNITDKCFELLTLRKERRVEELAEKVLPVYEEFQNQHKYYIECFENYRKIVRASHPDKINHPVYDIIRKDHVFSQGDRARLAALSNRLTTQNEHNKADPVNKFVHSIIEYFIWGELSIYEDLMFGPNTNDPRSTLITGLLFTFDLSPDEAIDISKRAKNKRLLWIVDKAGLGYIESDIQWSQLKREIVEAKNDTSKIKIALAIGFIEYIVSRVQSQFGQVTENYLLIREELTR